MRKMTKRSAAIVAVTAVAIGGGAAYAATAWFSGTGKATAASSEAKPVAAVATIADGAKLWPGKNVNAAVSVTNPNDYPVKVTGLENVLVKSNKSGCTAENADVTLGEVPANMTVGGKPAGFVDATPTDLGNWTDFVKMGSNADPACAGATFTITFGLKGGIAS